MLALDIRTLWALSSFSSFWNEDFSAKVCQAFPIWLQTRACHASFDQFSRPEPVRCYVFSVWYVCRIAFTLRVLLFIRLGWQPWTHAAMRPHATKCTRHFTACMRLLHCSMRPHATKCTRHFMACMRLAAALQHMAAAAAALRHAFVACEVNSIARAHTIGNS